MSPQIFASWLTIFLGAALAYRTLSLHRQGIPVIQFGKLDKTDFLIPPFGLFFFYHIFANGFHLPSLAGQPMVNNLFTQWLGVGVAVVGLAFAAWGIVSFKHSLRIGIDVETPGEFITNGAFQISRNPLYVGFLFFLLGQFLIFPSLFFLLFLLGGTWLMDRQIKREEDFMTRHYGEAFAHYAQKVRRYL